MTNQWVLSIIAKPPDGVNARTGASDGNKAIELIVDSLTKAAANGDTTSGSRYRTAVARAAYVRDISEAVVQFKATHRVAPDIIQCIGHGMSGRLELGSFWSGVPQDRVLGSAVLDSNPDSYGMLLDYITSTSRVFLLGCHVGSSAPSGYVASGRTLLFDLEDLTEANVYAADDLVYPELFEDGLYRGSLVTSTGKPANPAVLPFAPGTTKGTPGPNARSIPKMNRILSAPALGFHAPLATTQGASFIKLFGRYTESASQRPLLAMSEVAFAADGYARVDAICGLRYVRFQDKQGNTVYYEHPRIQPNIPGPPDPSSALQDLRKEYMRQRASPSA